jgi:hypothetical protein
MGGTLVELRKLISNFELMEITFRCWIQMENGIRRREKGTAEVGEEEKDKGFKLDMLENTVECVFFLQKKV